MFSVEERDTLLADHPDAEPLLKRFVSGEDFIWNKLRYCLWLKGESPAKYARIPIIVERLKRVAERRRQSPTASVKAAADSPAVFTQIRQPETEYLAIPQTSSERREYIPIGFMSPDIIASDKIILVPEATPYLFGVLTSSMHMAWMRTVAGRLKSDYSYYPAVYNNYPWPTPTAEQKGQIEACAQGVLDARALYPDCSLADLYDPLTMPAELRKAHRALDAAVERAYGRKFKDDAERVAHLFELYQELTK